MSLAYISVIIMVIWYRFRVIDSSPVFIRFFYLLFFIRLSFVGDFETVYYF